MKKIIPHTLVITCATFLSTSCIPNFLKNNDSIPRGYEKIDFSPLLSPKEMIRDPLEKSGISISSINYIFPNYSSNLVDQVKTFSSSNQSLNSILNEYHFANFVSSIPNFPDTNNLTSAINLLDNASFIKTVTPLDSFDIPKTTDLNNIIFTEIVGQQKDVPNLNEIQFFNKNGLLIDDKNIQSSYTVNTYYARNLYPSWEFSLPLKYNSTDKNKSWEFLVQCVSAKIKLDADNTEYTTAWPRITILLLNPTQKITDRNIIIKNSLILDKNLTPNLTPYGNLYQRILRAHTTIVNNFIPQSYLYTALSSINKPIQNTSDPLIGNSYSYFQDGMTSFFSQFSGAAIDKEKVINTFASWQILVNKSWFDITRNLDSHYKIPDYLSNIPINFLNNQNIPTTIFSSRDFQNGGIHYIDPTDKTNLLSPLNSIDATNIGLSEVTLNNICSNIITQ